MKDELKYIKKLANLNETTDANSLKFLLAIEEYLKKAKYYSEKLQLQFGIEAADIELLDDLIFSIEQQIGSIKK